MRSDFSLKNESMRLLMFWAPADRISSPTEKINAKTIITIPTDSVVFRTCQLVASSYLANDRALFSTDSVDRFYEQILSRR